LFNQESELAVLSILLKHPDLGYSLENLKNYMFSSTGYQILYSSFSELLGQGLYPDKNLLINHLSSKGKLGNAGGEEVINYIYSLDYNQDNLPEFVRQVQDDYKKRIMLSKAGEISSRLSAGEDINTIIDDIQKTTELLETSYGGEDTVSLLDYSTLGLKIIEEKIENPGISGISTGIKDIDLGTNGIGKGHLWLLAGRPGMGKTQIIVNMLRNATMQGNRALIFELEMPKQALLERLLGIEAGINTTDIEMGLLSKEQLTTLREGIDNIKHLPIYIDTNSYADIKYVETTIKKFVQLRDVNLVFIDYVQLMSERGDDQTHELGRITARLKKLAKALNIGIVLLSQINRNVESRPDKRPALSDLRQSGNLEEDADLVAMLYRDDYYDPTKNQGQMEFIIRKGRYTSLKTILLTYDGATSRIGSFSGDYGKQQK